MAALGSVPTNGLGFSPRISPHIDPALTKPLRQPVLTRGGAQYMSKHFAHPEALPLMLSLSMGVGCYMGLKAVSRHNASAAEDHPAWKGKGYRLGLIEDSVQEVMFSIDM